MLLTPLIHEPTRTPFHTPGNLWVTRWKLQASWNLQTITGLWGPWACQRQSFGLGYRWEIGVLNTWVFQTQYFQFNSPDSHNKYNLEFEYYKKKCIHIKRILQNERFILFGLWDYEFCIIINYFNNSNFSKVQNAM